MASKRPARYEYSQRAIFLVLQNELEILSFASKNLNSLLICALMGMDYVR